MKKEYGYTLNVKIKTDTTFFGPGVAELLTRIDRNHSINQSAKEMKMSYNKAWNILKKAEMEMGYPLVIKSVGGSHGGGTVVTDDGKQLIERFFRFQEKMYETADQYFKEIFPEW